MFFRSFPLTIIIDLTWNGKEAREVLNLENDGCIRLIFSLKKNIQFNNNDGTYLLN